MPTFYLRLALLPFILITAVILAVRVQPYDAQTRSELDQQLFSSDCAAPCFLGIRPFKTTVNEAIDLLDKSGWVNDIVKVKKCCEPFFYDIIWSPEAPSWLDRTWGSYFAATPDERIIFVDIGVADSVHFVDLYRTDLGGATVTVSSVTADRYSDAYECQGTSVYYADISLGFMARHCNRCPSFTATLLMQPVSNIVIGQWTYDYNRVEMPTLNSALKNDFCNDHATRGY
ncbi:MAG: hypothetical protein IT321_21680 [Anaerolineae bacterium]|nr:hypothetical protein [Anaerolineae bacterium]